MVPVHVCTAPFRRAGLGLWRKRLVSKDNGGTTAAARDAQLAGMAAGRSYPNIHGDLFRAVPAAPQCANSVGTGARSSRVRVTPPRTISR
ncbi:MAG: hypothetical protein V7631_2983 [Massilia sp.]|jgi:hypothetical protein